MDAIFEDLCLAEDYSSDEEKCRVSTINCLAEVEWEVKRYLTGENHHLIQNLHYNGEAAKAGHLKTKDLD
jgi:hypothetical protein